MYIGRVVFFVSLTVASYVLSALSFAGKGIILDDAYVFASKEARKTMDKRAYNTQSGWLFLCFGTTFLLYTLKILLDMLWLMYAAFGVIGIAVVYAIVSHYAIRKKAK